MTCCHVLSKCSACCYRSKFGAVFCKCCCLPNRPTHFMHMDWKKLPSYDTFELLEKEKKAFLYKQFSNPRTTEHRLAWLLFWHIKIQIQFFLPGFFSLRSSLQFYYKWIFFGKGLGKTFLKYWNVSSWSRMHLLKIIRTMLALPYIQNSYRI